MPAGTKRFRLERMVRPQHSEELAAFASAARQGLSIGGEGANAMPESHHLSSVLTESDSPSTQPVRNGFILRDRTSAMPVPAVAA